MDAETRYRMLGRLIQEMPVIPVMGPIPPPVMEWLGRADALVGACVNNASMIDWRLAQSMLSINREKGIEAVQLFLYRVLAAQELIAPATTRGAFIPVGSPYDAFAALTKLLQPATTDVLIIDPYLDEIVLREFGTAVPEGVQLRLLADQLHHKASLVPAARRWIEQHGMKRPLYVRLASPRSLHDRALIVDRRDAWTLTQSFNHFAQRSPAEIVSASDIAELKIPAYEAIWDQAVPLV